MADTFTLGSLMGILQQYDPAKDTPLVATVYDESVVEGESEVPILNVRLETTVDATGEVASRLVFEADVPK